MSALVNVRHDRRSAALLATFSLPAVSFRI
jgi:hypothetical protein